MAMMAIGITAGALSASGNYYSSTAQADALDARADYEEKAAVWAKESANQSALSKEYEYQAAISDKRREFDRFNASNRALRGASGTAVGGSNLLVEIENMTLQELQIQNMKVASDNQAKFTRYEGSVSAAEHLNAAADARAGASNTRMTRSLQLGSDIVGTIGKGIQGLTQDAEFVSKISGYGGGYAGGMSIDNRKNMLRAVPILSL